MSKILVITYDLRPDATPSDYARLAAALCRLGATRLFLSSWAIRTSQTPAQLADELSAHVDAAKDHVLIVEAAAHAQINTTPLETL